MSFYEKVKDWLKQKENKDKLVLGLSFVLVFIVGFGAGSYVRETRRDSSKPQANYTTAAAKKPANTATSTQGQVLGKTTTAASSTQASTCVVKGNISSTGKKIYHVQGGAFYNRVKPEQCFNTEAEALAAGFVKSSR